MPDFIPDRLHDDGLTYDDDHAHWREQKERSLERADPDERRIHHYLNYNWERQAHVHEEYIPCDEPREAVASIDEPQLWMVITEPWCGVRS